MLVSKINITLGTAGHVDHGKTALIKLLTGCDTDRLKEEKERGLSIELGFAPCKIENTEVGIVDVPGHEHFVKTMVAGATGMDGIILVVAADDGIMPQTREHLDILTLLDVQHGLVALTKIDRVQADHVEIVREELKDFLRGTFLDGAPIMPVSSVTGEGLEEFYRALVSLVRSVEAKPVDGVFRLPVERAFSVKGYGTVVAGIPVSGSAEVGDEVVLLPQALKGRISAAEVYQRPAKTVMAGQCAALNLRHWDHNIIHRGNTLTVPEYFSPQQWYACELRLLPGGGRFSLKSGAHLKFHTGTSEMVAAVYLMQGDRIEAGQECLVQVNLEEPLVAGPGDRFVLRTLSPSQTVGGGLIIEGIPRRLKRNRPGVLENLRERAKAVLKEKDFVAYCVKEAASSAAGGVVALEAVSFRAKVPKNRIEDVLNELVRERRLVRFDRGLYLHQEAVSDLERRLLAILRDYHQRSPESPGLCLRHLQESLGLHKDVLEGLLARLRKHGKVVERNRRLALSEHRESFTEEERQYVAIVESLYREQAFKPPRVGEVVEKAGTSREMVERVIRILLEHERLVRVTDDLLFHRGAVDRAGQILESFIREHGRLESVEFKYLLDTTRKFAIPLLDYFDRVGMTRRVGNTRYLYTS